MNLPEKSLEYLQEAERYIKKGGMIHFYFFDQKENNFDKYKKQFISLLKKKFEIMNIFQGREVSPSKIQINCDLKILE
jgi:tRNA G37 N-methylase Trm5